MALTIEKGSVLAAGRAATMDEILDLFDKYSAVSL